MPFITLAIETTGHYGGIALLDKDQIIGEASFSSKKTHSRRLLPLIKFLFKEMGIEFSDLSLVSVSQGPGSFTGLRIGMSVAKGLAFGLNIPIIGVPTLDALAHLVTGCPGDFVCPVVDARKNQFYCGLYKIENHLNHKRITDYAALSAKAIAEKLKNKKVWLIGSGVELLLEQMESLENTEIKQPSNVINRALPSAVGYLGYKTFKDQGKGHDLSLIKPLYVRPSDAELNFNRKKGRGAA